MTTATARTLDDYLHNPEDMPTDPDEIAKLVLGAEGVVDGQDDTAGKGQGDDAQGEGNSNPNPEGDTTTTTPTEGDTSGAKEERPEGVLAKDGKHVIPYAVLEADRRARADAERVAQEATERAKALEEQLRRAQAGTQTEADKRETGETTQDLLAQLEELTEEVPALRDLLKPMAQTINALQSKVNELSQEVAVTRDERVNTAADAVQQAIDRNPYLRYWQNEDAETFNRAAQIDKLLREDPANRGMSVDDRFERVVKAMHVTYGKTDLPETYRPQGSSSKSSSGTGDAKERAEVKPPKEKDQSFTLSDLPGGVSPNRDDRRFEDMTVNELEEKIAAQLDRGVPMDQVLSQFG